MLWKSIKKYGYPKDDKVRWVFHRGGKNGDYVSLGKLEDKLILRSPHAFAYWGIFVDGGEISHYGDIVENIPEEKRDNQKEKESFYESLKIPKEPKIITYPDEIEV